MPVHYPFVLDVAAHPDYSRRPFKVPAWSTFENKPQFLTLRSLHQSRWKEDLDLYTERFGLGRVIWPMVQFLYVPHVAEVIEELRKRKLYLFDLWSHVPGSPMYGVWSNIVPPEGMVEHLRRTLGDRFLGIDNGEQDGRYIGGYAPQQCPARPDRFGQYLNFHRHFRRMGDELGNHLSTLVSLCFGHYFVKEGNHCLIGAETAQALPNSQVYYAFIRGAGKQYGVHWFGNASVYNRWGWKSYERNQDGQGDGNFGPEKGTSVSLLKRLMYSHMLYNCVAVGFESGWLKPARKRDAESAVPAGGHSVATTEPDQWELTPVGNVQASAVKFVEQLGEPGLMHAPVALMLDFCAGWAMPRHLYTGRVYQVWGALPYEAGDYLTHGLLELLYPGYEDASYFRDERGFLSPTPFGDMTDCLLSDAPGWVLRQYGTIFLAGSVAIGAELRDKLQAFVRNGGRLAVTAANLDAGLVPGLAIRGDAQPVDAGTVVTWTDGQQDRERDSFAVFAATLPPGNMVLASCQDRPVAVEIPFGQGAFVVSLTPLGLNSAALTGPVRSAEEEPLPCPYELLAHVRRLFGRELAAQQIFRVSEGLTFVTCRGQAGRYTLGVFNNSLTAKPLKIEAAAGVVESVQELPVERSEEGALGWWPEGLARHDGGRNTPTSIAGGATRLFDVRIREQGLVCLPRAQMPPRPRGRILSLRKTGSIEEAILARPTFFQHFDGVKLDWTWVRDHDRRQIRDQGQWLQRQQVRVWVDFSSGLNLYPDLTFLDTYPPAWERTRRDFQDVTEKMRLLGAADAVIALHRRPENHVSVELCRERTIAGMRTVCADAPGIAFHLQSHPMRWFDWCTPEWKDIVALAEEAAIPNLHLAIHTGHLRRPDEELPAALRAVGDRLSAVLLARGTTDTAGQFYDAHAPLHPAAMDTSPLKALAVPLVFDAIYPSADEEYLDARMFEDRD